MTFSMPRIRHDFTKAQEAIMLSATREKSVARIGQLEVFVTVEVLGFAGIGTHTSPIPWDWYNIFILHENP